MTTSAYLAEASKRFEGKLLEDQYGNLFAVYPEEQGCIFSIMSVNTKGIVTHHRHVWTLDTLDYVWQEVHKENNGIGWCLIDNQCPVTYAKVDCAACGQLDYAFRADYLCAACRAKS